MTLLEIARELVSRPAPELVWQDEGYYQCPVCGGDGDIECQPTRLEIDSLSGIDFYGFDGNVDDIRRWLTDGAADYIALRRRVAELDYENSNLLVENMNLKVKLEEIANASKT
jgi:hypothetical protein